MRLSVPSLPLPNMDEPTATAGSTSAPAGGYLLAEETITQDAVAAHRSGEQPIAIYLFSGETTRLAALDIDNHASELDWQEVAKRTLSLVEDLRSRDMTPFVVRSGGGSGIHIWLIWREPQSCRSIRRLLARILRKHGFKPGTGGIAKGEIEVYPKQDTVAHGKVGNPIALPFSRRSAPSTATFDHFPSKATRRPQSRVYTLRRLVPFRLTIFRPTSGHALKLPFSPAFRKVTKRRPAPRFGMCRPTTMTTGYASASC